MDKSNIIMYQTEDGMTKISVALENDTVWLTQAQMAELFQTTPQNITLHIGNIYKEGELLRELTCKDFLQVQTEGNRSVKRSKQFYNLDVIISVGYRVKSLRGTQFRIWANNVIKEYMIKGFALNDDLLKQAGGGDYFKELLARIRDIRSSERVFYRQILEIYATSADYNKNSELSQQFFKVVQNKMHWAAHGHTAAELILERANADKPFMGMTSFKGTHPTLSDAKVAKNYLSEDELDTLNRIVSMYLDFAELQAKNHKVMYMKDWIAKLDDFLKISERDILDHAGKVSKELAYEKAKAEFYKYKETHDELSPVERDFLESIINTQKQIEGKKQLDTIKKE